MKNDINIFFCFNDSKFLKILKKRYKNVEIKFFYLIFQAENRIRLEIN